MESVVNKKDLICIRDGIGSDRAFIFSTWLRGLRHGNDHFGLMDSDSYFKHYHAKLEALLDDFDVTIKIACLKEDPDVILGYSISKNDRLDWVFIKKSWRNIGLAKDLVPPGITAVTHLTKVGMSLLRKHPNVIFNPYKE